MNKYYMLSLLVIAAAHTVTMATGEYSTMGAETNPTHQSTPTNLSTADANAITTGLKNINSNVSKYPVKKENKANIQAALAQINTITGISVVNVNNSFGAIGTQIQSGQYVVAKGSSSGLLSKINTNIQQATDATLKNSLTDAKNQLMSFNATLDALSKL
ncbi:MAG: hypothetical protein WCE21_01270 [Candidatus Babeliales bacterium]